MGVECDPSDASCDGSTNQFELTLLHETTYDVSFADSDHALEPGDVVRFMPIMDGTCAGAAAADPAVYGGHREIDLAMMRPFGGFSERAFDAYNASYPLAQGYEDRRALYQLYPLLVHLNLFGGHYGASALRAAERYL